MSVKNFMINFAFIFCITFIVSILVSYLYSLIAHGAGSIDWPASLRNGITFGIILPIVMSKSLNKK